MTAPALLAVTTTPLHPALGRLPTYLPRKMPDSSRGDSILRAHRALNALHDGPGRLQLDRERFCRSPLAYLSQPSDSTRLDLKLERYASQPPEQFLA
jgi:hypothetical protein